MHTNSGWQLSAEATKNPLLLNAILDVALNFLYREGCLGGLCAHGVQKLPPLSTGALGSITIYWNASDITDYHYFHDDDALMVNMDALTKDWRNTFLIQFAFYDTSTTAMARMDEPTVPQLGGVREDVLQQQDTNSGIVRTPITVSDDITEVDDDDF